MGIATLIGKKIGPAVRVVVVGKNLYPVKLSQTEREQLQQLIRSGKRPARETARARILLKTDEGWSAPKVAESLDLSVGTVFRTKRRFSEEGLEGALQERPRPPRRRKLDDKGEAHLIALACSPAPEGHDHWTLRLLAGRVVELGLAPSMSHEGIRKRLKKTPSNRGRKSSGAFLR
jgi:transposase